MYTKIVIMAGYNISPNHTESSIQPHVCDVHTTPHDSNATDPASYYTYQGPVSAVSSLRPTLLAETYEPITTTKEGFQVATDVHQFAPKDITVKTVGYSILVEADHEKGQQDKNGEHTSELIRQFPIPNGYNPDSVIPELSSDGILTINAPPDDKTTKAKRELPMDYTKPTRFHMKKKMKRVGKKNIKKMT